MPLNQMALMVHPAILDKEKLHIPQTGASTLCRIMSQSLSFKNGTPIAYRKTIPQIIPSQACAIIPSVPAGVMINDRIKATQISPNVAIDACRRYTLVI